MEQQLYQISEFAEKASVSVRTLRYYDQQGLLSPSQYSASGYRLYTETDLVQLQYILALKYLGFSLEEIRLCLQTGPHQLPDLLAQQKAMLLEKRAHLDSIIRAIEDAERITATPSCDSISAERVLQAIQAEQRHAWIRQHLTPQQRANLKECYETSYSEEARQKLHSRTPAESRERAELYQAFRAQLQRLSAAGADPTGWEAQEMAKLLQELNARASQGDPAVLEGMRKSWATYHAMPATQRPPGYDFTEAEREFLKQAMIHFARN